MTLTYDIDDVLQSTADALVNPVNCKGVMGKGLALQFRRRFPLMYHDYVDVCYRGWLCPGVLHVYSEDGKLIINFPTKDDWRQPSELAYIEKGLTALHNLILQRDIKSIAIPKLGCGLGGLEWGIVHSMILEALDDLDVEIHLDCESGS